MWLMKISIITFHITLLSVDQQDSNENKTRIPSSLSKATL